MNIPDERIKTITAFQEGYDADYLTEYVLREIAYGITQKLKEFHKVKILKIENNGYFRAECTISIIVPPRNNSERAVPSMPPTE